MENVYSIETRHSERAQADEVEDDLISFRDPGHRAGTGALIEEPCVRNTNLAV